jgi:hypothetical protein
MTTKRRKRHSPEQIVRKLRDADAMLNAGKDLSDGSNVGRWFVRLLLGSSCTKGCSQRSSNLNTNTDVSHDST